MAQAILETFRTAEQKLLQLLESSSNDVKKVEEENNQLRFQLDALQEHITLLESRHADSISNLEGANKQLSQEKEELAKRNEQLIEDVRIHKRSIERLESMRFDRANSAGSSPLQEKEVNIIRKPKVFTDAKDELAALSIKYEALKQYNEKMSTKYRKERNVWKEWTDLYTRKGLDKPPSPSLSLAEASPAPAQAAHPVSEGQETDSTQDVEPTPRADRTMCQTVVISSPLVKNEIVSQRRIHPRTPIKRSASEMLSSPTPIKSPMRAQSMYISPSKHPRTETSRTITNERPYHEVVRGKEARKALHASDCACCSDFYKLAGPGMRNTGPAWRSPPQTVPHDTKQQVGRHRSRWQRSPTPPLFWDCDFPTTQQLAQEREQNRERRARKSLEKTKR